MEKVPLIIATTTESPGVNMAGRVESAQQTTFLKMKKQGTRK